MAIQLLPGEHAEILTELEVGLGEVVCWNTKAAISLKLVEIKLLWRAYRNSPTFFRTVRSPTPTAFSAHRLGFATPTQISNRCYLKNGWSYELQLWQEHSHGPTEQSPLKFLWKERMGVSKDCPILGVPLLSQDGVKLRTSNFVRIFLASIRRKAH